MTIFRLRSRVIVAGPAINRDRARWWSGLALFLLATCPLQVLAETPWLTARVTSVSRGDRMVLSGDAIEGQVGLFGARCREPRAVLGAQARKFTEALVGHQDIQVRVRLVQPSHRWVEVRLPDGRILNHALLRSGLAQFDEVSASGDQEYKSYEADARGRGLGIWKRAAKAETATPASGSGDTRDPVERFKRIKSIEKDARFELALGHWSRSTQEERLRIRNLIVGRTEDWNSRFDGILVESDSLIEEIEEDIQATRKQIDSLEAQLERDAMDEDDEIADLNNDPDLEHRRRKLEDAELDVEVTYRDYGYESTFSLNARHRAEVEVELYAQALALIDTEIAAIEGAHRQRRQATEMNLDALDLDLGDLVDEKADAEDDRERALDDDTERSRRFASQLRLADSLDNALNTGYRMKLGQSVVKEWKGTGTMLTDPFAVDAEVWAIDFDTFQNEGRRNFGATLRRAADKAPVTMLRNSGLPHQSFNLFKEGGSFYLDIETKREMSYEIRVIEFSPLSATQAP